MGWQDSPIVDAPDAAGWQSSPVVKDKPPPAPDDSMLGRLKQVPGQMREAVGAVAEPVMAMGSGLAGKVAGDIGGLTALAPGGADPDEVKRKIQEAMTYQPRTEAGKSPMNPLNAIPEWIGKLIASAGGKAGELVAPPGSKSQVQVGAGRGVEELVKQLPGFLGLKAPGAAAAAGGAVKGGARGIMQSALKPTIKAQETGKAARGIDTLLDEGINVTRGGAEKLQDRVTVLNDRVKDLIANSTATVSKSKVAESLLDKLDKFTKQVTPSSDLRALQNAFDDFMDHPLLKGGDAIPVQLAQELKQGTTRALGDKAYGELKGADIEAQKALARGLKEEIAKAVPEVRPLNAQESNLLNALSMVERRVLMSANKNPIGLGLLSSSPTKMLAWMADRSELFKSLIARMLNTSAKAAPPIGAMGPPLGLAVGTQAQLQPPPQ